MIRFIKLLALGALAWPVGPIVYYAWLKLTQQLPEFLPAMLYSGVLYFPTAAVLIAVMFAVRRLAGGLNVWVYAALGAGAALVPFYLISKWAAETQLPVYSWFGPPLILLGVAFYRLYGRAPAPDHVVAGA
jgi:hypothetical protein